jgi:hypothetical protein
MLDRTTDYVKHYLKKVGNVSQDILVQDYSSLQEYKMPWTYGYVENGCWYFRVIKSQDTGICLDNYVSDDLKDLVNDPNIMCIGVNRFPPETMVKEHVDPPYYGKNLWRILVPIKASNAYLKGMYGSQKIEEGKCYIFDLTYELHHGWNSSKEEDFVIMTIDILYEDQSDYDMDSEENFLKKNYSRRDLDYYYTNNVYKKIANIDLSMYEKVEDGE